jgi:hypothetical protein
MKRVGRYLLGSSLLVVGVVASFEYRDGYEMWKWAIFGLGTVWGTQLLLGPTVRKLWEKRNASLVARGLKSPSSESRDAEAGTRR